MQIISRTGWGARPARSGVQTVAPSARRLVIVHYSGAPADQSLVDIQRWCMDGRGFKDIDYNFLVRGTTGEVYEGRGWDAVGSHTTGHNTEALGFCVISPGPISDAAKASMRWLFFAAQKRAGHPLGHQVHRDYQNTDCPGDVIAHWVRSGGLTSPPPAAPRTLRLERPYLVGDDVRAVQEKVGVQPDGSYGPDTTAAVERFQHAHGLVADGEVGPLTRAAMRIG